MSQGFGLTLIAETTSGRFISTERCISGAELLRCREAQIVPDDIGQETACALLDEIKRCACMKMPSCDMYPSTEVLLAAHTGCQPSSVLKTLSWLLTRIFGIWLKAVPSLPRSHAWLHTYDGLASASVSYR